MEANVGHAFRSSGPTMATKPLAPGEAVYDEGMFVCVGCGLAGSEVSLLPGEETPECPRCGAEARWVKT